MSLDDRKAAILTYLSVKLPYTWRVLKQMLVGLLGEGNFEMSLDNETQKITIALASTVEHLRGQVDSLIERVVPQNLVFEYDNCLPIDYTPVEYLDNGGSLKYIDIDMSLGQNTEASIRVMRLSDNYTACLSNYGGGSKSYAIFIYALNANGGFLRFDYGASMLYTQIVPNKGEWYQIEKKGRMNYLNGENVQNNTEQTFEPLGTALLFALDPVKYPNICGRQRIAEAIFNNGLTKRHFTPALDPLGAPCMFDLVSRNPFYNAGSGDFIYPTNEVPVMTLDLDEKFYAKLTEHGVRRLYHVPKGYTGSKDQYAAENGFKELVEPPMPLEGYWMPEWRETDTQLILEWVETEPPMEVTENE
jgi:hypothetical protein